MRLMRHFSLITRPLYPRGVLDHEANEQPVIVTDGTLVFHRPSRTLAPDEYTSLGAP